jgi:glycosyltransferase involved in cell wall biosynthesis
VRLLTVGSLPPEWGGPVRGGAATFHAALLTELGRRDDVELVGVLPPGPLDREIAVPALIRPENVSRAAFYEELLERLRPDAVLMNHFAHTVGVTHARLDSPVPAVGVAQSWHGVTFSAAEERARALALTREAIGGLAGLVAVSRHTAEEGRSLGFDYPPLAETIHNPVPPLYMEDDFDVAAGERDGVLFLGSLIPRKRPEALVRAVTSLPAVHALLVGQGDLEDDLRAEVAARGLADRVRLAAPPDDDGHLPWIRDALLRAEVMCLPSSSEGLPLAFVEALACGTPIVGFGPAVREIREELGVDVGVPLDEGTPEEIAGAIESVRATEWDRSELRRAVLDRFGLDRVVDRYVDLLERVVDEPARAAAPESRVGPRRPRRRATGALAGTPICVLGSSRSGTSLTARLLNLAGVYLGPEEELLGEDRRQLAGEGEEVLAKAAHSNPGGHWEHYRLMRINERILRAFGGTWREPPPLPRGWQSSAELDDLREEARELLVQSFAGHELWGWKDPRISLTLSFWQGLLPSMRYVVCMRNPLDVAASLERRDGLTIERGLALWRAYAGAALAGTAGRLRLLVAYESFFSDPTGVAAGLADFVGRGGAFDGERGERLLAGAIDERLWRHRNGR